VKGFLAWLAEVTGIAETRIAELADIADKTGETRPFRNEARAIAGDGRGMGSTQHLMLKILAAEGALSLVELARRIPQHVRSFEGSLTITPWDTRSAARESCRSLVRRGWAREIAGPGFEITPEGQAALADRYRRGGST
jgi:hypothetical protein